MTEAMSDPPREAHVAACGLFCTNCRAFKKGKCPGCQIAPRFRSCGIRACCVEKGILTCAECAEFASPRDYRECKTVNNLVAKVFAFLFKTDRPGALAVLRDEGRDAYLSQKRESGKM